MGGGNRRICLYTGVPSEATNNKTLPLKRQKARRTKNQDCPLTYIHAHITGTGEMAQTIKYLPHKHEDLSLNSRIHVKKGGGAGTYSIKHSTKDVTIDGALEPTG